MRASSALLIDTGTRLWELVFPWSRVLLARTRVPYVDLDGLIAFSKRDRDGKVDAYLAAYLPDEVALVYFLDGDVVNATMLTPVGRFAVPIAQALQHVKAEAERSEIAFHQAPREQLAAMYATCTQQATGPLLQASSPDAVFRTLYDARWSGALELISNGRVNYIEVRDGRYAAGFFSDQRPEEPPMSYVARLFQATPGEPLPRVTARAYDGLQEMPLQAPPAMVAMLRHFVWDLADRVETEWPGEGLRRAERVRQRLLAQEPLLQSFGLVRDVEGSDPLAEPRSLAGSVAEWTAVLLTEMEIVHPQAAPRVLRDSAREHRFALNALGFFERLPWRVQW